jgi:hypothetical protein
VKEVLKNERSEVAMGKDVITLVDPCIFEPQIFPHRLSAFGFYD